MSTSRSDSEAESESEESPKSVSGGVSESVSENSSESGDTTAGLSRRRDAGLAVVAASGLLGTAWWLRGSLAGAVATVSHPPAVVLGVGGAFLLELGFARFPSVATRLWATRWVRVAGTGAVAVGVPAVAVVVARRDARLATWLLSLVVGGLVGYAALLVAIVGRLLPSPETWFADG